MCHSIFIHNFWQTVTGLKKNSFTVGHGSKFATRPVLISHHTYNVLLHYLVKNIKNSKILTYLTQHHRLPNKLNCCVYSWVTLDAKMSFIWYGRMHGNIFVTLIKFTSHDVDELNQRLTKICLACGLGVWTKCHRLRNGRFARLWACVHAKERHFEHLIWFKNIHANF